jgi:hypothetical protein
LIGEKKRRSPLIAIARPSFLRISFCDGLGTLGILIYNADRRTFPRQKQRAGFASPKQPITSRQELDM